MRKRLTVICGFFLFIMLMILIYIVFKIDILNIFKKGGSINYNENISYIEIFNINIHTKDNVMIKIDDKEDIKEIFKYLNSLELVECEPPSHYFDTNKYTYLAIYGKEEQLNVITISSRYLYITKKAYNWTNKVYYIKNAGYNPITQNNNIYKNLKKIIDGEKR